MNEDQHKRLTERERAHQARIITEHPLWEEAWTALESRLMQGWLRTQTGEAERRELIYLQLRAASEVRAEFERILTTGRMAESQLLERSNERASPEH